MSYQFQCPFCRAAIEAEHMSAECAVECPLCSQSFIVEAPPEPVRVRAMVVPAVAAPLHAAPPAARHAAPHPPHHYHAHAPGHHPHAYAHEPMSPGQRRRAARREEARAKFAIIALLGGGTLLIAGLIWAAGIMRNAVEKRNAIHHDPPSKVGPVSQKIFDDLEKQKKEEAEREAHAAKLNEEWKINKEKREVAEAKQRRKFIASVMAHDIFDGDMAVAEEAARELEETEKEVYGRFSDGVLNNEPDNPGLEIQKVFLGRLMANRTISDWARKRSIKDFTRLAGGGTLRGPDGKPVDPDSILGMLLSGKYSGSGSGFWISADGWLLTNAHVTGDAGTVDLRNQTGKIVKASVVKTSKDKDLALLKTEESPLAWLPITAGEAKEGRQVFAAGFPRPVIQGVECKITPGAINGLSGYMDNKDQFQCSVSIFPGNSGGPLVETASGWVVGIISSQIVSKLPSDAAAGPVSYAIKASVARDFIASVPGGGDLLKYNATLKSVSGNDEAVARAKQAAVLLLVK